MKKTNKSAYALKNWLRDNRITQAAFAEIIGLQGPSVSKMVNGKSMPTIQQARRIAVATGGSVSIEGWVIETAVGEITLQAAE